MMLEPKPRPTAIAIPPINGTRASWRLRPPGTSTSPTSTATGRSVNMKRTVTTNARNGPTIVIAPLRYPNALLRYGSSSRVSFQVVIAPPTAATAGPRSLFDAASPGACQSYNTKSTQFSQQVATYQRLDERVPAPSCYTDTRTRNA